MSRSVFEQTPSSIAGDLHDSVSLLWRLELAGRSPRERWRPFTAIARERMNRQGLHFHVAHMAMALAAGGDWAGAEQHLGIARERAPKDRSGLVGDVVVPLVEGLHAFAAGDYARTIARLSVASADRGAGRQPRAARRSTTRCSRRASAPATPSGPPRFWPSAWPVAPILLAQPRGVSAASCRVTPSADSARRSQTCDRDELDPAALAAGRGPAARGVRRAAVAECSAARRRGRITLLQINDVYTLEPVDEGARRVRPAGHAGQAHRRDNPATVLALLATRSHPRWRPPCCRAGTIAGLNALGLDGRPSAITSSTSDPAS